uniref:Putative phosphatidylethanolamine-binding protein n=1 Tax=Aedes aegypti TaxID=7159 RepID=Q1HQW2_AEDAE|nr:putative phosphatidylethanolamine-binding protein [Aedes aegypti]
MTKRTFLFVVLTVSGTMIAVSKAEDPAVAKAFTDNEIVPDVLSKAPGALVKVSYTSAGAEVNLGNELTPTQVKDEPSVSWEAEPGALYTLVMTDPDAPTRAEPKMREWKHWVVINVPGSDVAAGETVAEYIGSAPPQDSGLHRYVFLVYKQSRGRMRWSEPKLSNRNPNRAKFRVNEFAAKYHLGSPIAGNFYQATYDDYVPQVYATLTETK